jgi:hypothetical protein
LVVAVEAAPALPNQEAINWVRRLLLLLQLVLVLLLVLLLVVLHYCLIHDGYHHTVSS